MKRSPYALLVGVAVAMGVIAFVVSQLVDEGLMDPDGFLGPAWVRLPAMVLAAFLVDIVPRSLWRTRGRLGQFRSEARTLVRDHWTRDRITLVVVALTSFYVTYVSYRNLKNFLPKIYENDQDHLLHQMDRLLFLGHEPATVLHSVLGETWAAHFFAFVYLLYLPLAPLSLVIWIVWSRNTGYGYWYATANCLTWVFGTISYYALPSLGPAFSYPWLYRGLDVTGVTKLQDSLWYQRTDVMYPLNPLGGSIQSVAGFASLHVALTLVIALVAQHTVRHAAVRWAAWIYCGLTTVSTLYFGWHFVADDIAGAVIAYLSVWLGALATGQRFGPGTGPRRSGNGGNGRNGGTHGTGDTAPDEVGVPVRG